MSHSTPLRARSAGDWVSLQLHREALERFVPRGARVLEVSAGAGHYTEALHHLGCKISVLDSSLDELESHRARAHARGFTGSVESWAQGDICSLASFADASFDAVVAFGAALSHALERRDRALAECMRVLRPRGVLVLDAYSLWGSMRRNLPLMLARDLVQNRAIIRSGAAPEALLGVERRGVERAPASHERPSHTRISALPAREASASSPAPAGPASAALPAREASASSPAPAGPASADATAPSERGSSEAASSAALAPELSSEAARAPEPSGEAAVAPAAPASAVSLEPSSPEPGQRAPGQREPGQREAGSPEGAARRAPPPPSAPAHPAPEPRSPSSTRGERHCHLFRAAELEAFLRRAGLEVLSLSASSALSTGVELPAASDPGTWSALLEYERAACVERGYLDGGQHLIAIARR